MAAEVTRRLPWPALLVLAGIAFVALVSEIAPAGLLGPIADGLGVPESGAGLLVTAYALSSGITAIPAIAFTRGWPRRPLLLAVLAGFALVNLATAVTSSYAVMLVVRVVGGLCTGLLWSLVGNYAAQLAGPDQRGRALTIALGGGTVAFSTGVPGASALGAAAGWRTAFAVLGILAVVLLLLGLRLLAPVAGEPPVDRPSFLAVLRLPGTVSIAGVVGAMIVGHNVLYTYVEPFADRARVPGGVGAVLLLFGAGTFGGMWLTARAIDAHHRATVLASLSVVLVALVGLGVGGRSAAVVLAAAPVWGTAYGGLAALTQTAMARVGGGAADVAVSVGVTAWSVAIAAGAFVGGLVLDDGGVAILPWVAAGFLALAIAGATAARTHGFPPPA